MTDITVKFPTQTVRYQIPADQIADFLKVVLGTDQATALATLEAAGLTVDAIAAVTVPPAE